MATRMRATSNHLASFIILIMFAVEVVISASLNDPLKNTIDARVDELIITDAEDKKVLKLVPDQCINRDSNGTISFGNWSQVELWRGKWMWRDDDDEFYDNYDEYDDNDGEYKESPSSYDRALSARSRTHFDISKEIGKSIEELTEKALVNLKKLFPNSVFRIQTENRHTVALLSGPKVTKYLIIILIDVLDVLRDSRWTGVLSVESFDQVPVTSSTVNLLQFYSLCRISPSTFTFKSFSLS